MTEMDEDVKFKLYINGKVRNSELPLFAFKDRLEKKHLVKHLDGYSYTEKFVNDRVKSARHLMNYLRNPYYRMWCKFKDWLKG
jgi:hypothetical protein